ncbi:MAG: RloB family protein [Planctomycetaceae bacterium]
MPRKKRPLERDNGVVRDASLVVVASEDTHAVKQYFGRFRPRRVQFRVLGTEDGRSSPPDVMGRLDKFKDEFQIREDDQLWVCFDTDHWVEPGHIQNLAETIRLCKQKGYRLAISQPCFELWLLLHFVDFVPTGQLNCSEVVTLLRQVVGGYQKSQVHRLPIDSDKVLQAVSRAKAIDTTVEPIPSSPTTRVYLLIEELLAREDITLV